MADTTKKRRPKPLGKGKKLLREVAEKGRSRPLIINVSPDTAKMLKKILAYPNQAKLELLEGEEEVSDVVANYWEPRWLEVIYEMASKFATEEEIVAMLPYTYSMWLKLKADPVTRIREVLLAARSDGLLFLKSKFHTKVEEGNLSAIIFGLKTQAGWREDAVGGYGPDRGQDSGIVSGAVDRLLALAEGRRDGGGPLLRDSSSVQE